MHTARRFEVEDPGAIRDMIRAVAQGASEGVEMLRSAGVPVALEDFAIEITLGERGTEAAIVVQLAAEV